MNSGVFNDRAIADGQCCAFLIVLLRKSILAEIHLSVRVAQARCSRASSRSGGTDLVLRKRPVTGKSGLTKSRFISSSPALCAGDPSNPASNSQFRVTAVYPACHVAGRIGCA
jgi:hypothetical protein